MHSADLWAAQRCWGTGVLGHRGVGAQRCWWKAIPRTHGEVMGTNACPKSHFPSSNQSAGALPIPLLVLGFRVFLK